MNETLTIALSKGRIFKETVPLLKQAGIEPVDDPETSRKLILDTNHAHVKLVIIRATDVRPMCSMGRPMWAWRARMCCLNTAVKAFTNRWI